MNIVTPVFAGYRKAKVAPVTEIRQAIKSEDLGEDKPLSEEEYEKLEKRNIKANPDMVLPSIVYPV